jgi:hypothetical protein
MNNDAPQKVPITGHIDSRLYELVVKYSVDNNNMPVSECVAKLLATALGRPDLGDVPRKPMGRPRVRLADIQPTPKAAKKRKGKS